MLDEFAPFGSQRYYILLGFLALARAMDFISTFVATPNLVLEANPLARKMGWKIGIPVNVLLCVVIPLWPLPALVIITTSILVAARNFQSAWLMRSMGETNYRLWMTEKLSQVPRRLFFGCLLAQAILYTGVGLALMFYSHWHLVPFGIGMGMITYALAVFVYTLLSVWRIAARSV
jgi:hypothetical protein